MSNSSFEKALTAKPEKPGVSGHMVGETGANAANGLGVAGAATMRFAYADPPYLGCGQKLYGQHHADAADCDDPEWHRALINRLVDEYPDGWALSLHTPSLQTLLPMCPPDVRVMAWVKPFCSFKPGVGVAYAWEPVIVRGGRKRTRQDPTVRDWVSANITLQKGLTGAKPADLTRWLLEVLNVQRGDTLDDLFPGSGSVQHVLDAWFGKPCNIGLFGDEA